MRENISYLKKLVAERLAAIPPNISFSIGRFGDFSRDQLIQEVEKGTEVGKAMIDMQVHFIQQMPKLLAKTKQ